MFPSSLLKTPQNSLSYLNKKKGHSPYLHEEFGLRTRFHPNAHLKLFHELVPPAFMPSFSSSTGTAKYTISYLVEIQY